MKGPSEFFRHAVRLSDSFVLPHMLYPGRQEERFDEPVWIDRISEQLPSQGAIPEAFSPHVVHRLDKVLRTLRFNEVFDFHENRPGLGLQFHARHGLGPMQ